MSKIKSVKVIRSFPTENDYIPIGEVGYEGRGRFGNKDVFCFKLSRQDRKDRINIKFMNVDIIKQFEGEFFEVEYENDIDFSDYVKKYKHNLAIAGKQGILQSINDGDTVDITYTIPGQIDLLSYRFVEIPNYTECWLSELEYGDVFILEDDAKKFELDKRDFYIFFGCTYGDYIVKGLVDVGSGDKQVEIDTIISFCQDKKVYKFLRE